MEKLQLGPLVFEYQPDGKLRMVSDRTWLAGQGIILKMEGQKKLVDFMLTGLKEHLHKGGQSPAVDRIWQLIETAMNGGYKPGDRKAVISERAADMNVLEESFRQQCLTAATDEMKKGNVAAAAKIMEMYEAI